MIRAFVFVALCVALSYGESTVCAGQPDGTVPEWGCRSFSKCVGGQRTIVDCHVQGLVYNPATRACDAIGNVAPPCGLTKDCVGLKDGRYPEFAVGCRSYYTCYNGNYLGHNECPSNLVFDSGLDTCNHAGSVPAPCGTA